jgi:WD40 repeat protein
MKQAIHSCLKSCTLLLAFTLPTIVHAQADIVTFSHDNTRIREIIFTTNLKTLVVKSGEEVQVNGKGIVTSPSIHIWNMDEKRKTMAIADREFGRASAISRDGKLLAYREKNNINVMDLTTKKVFSTIRFDDNKFYKPTGFCNDNRGVIVEQGSVCSIYSIQTEKAEFIRNYSAPGLLHFVTKDDKYAIEMFGDSFRIQDFKSGNDIFEFPMIEKGKPEALRNIIISPENRFVATLSDNKVKMWDMVSHKMAHSLTILPKDNIFCFSPDGRFIIGGSDTLKIWELRTKREITTTIVGEGKLSCATVSPDGKFIASGDAKGNIQIWDFSDDNMSALYFAKEIDNELKQIQNQKEFEKTEDYKKRRQKFTRSTYNKYLTQYMEKLTTENTIQEHWAEEDDRRENEKRDLILNSRETIVFTIDSISTYNADKETFNIKIVNTKERYSRWEVVKVPFRDMPQCFKQRAQTLTITGTKQLAEDTKTYEIYNVKIKSSCSGKDKDYTFGPQRIYLDDNNPSSGAGTVKKE